MNRKKKKKKKKKLSAKCDIRLAVLYIGDVTAAFTTGPKQIDLQTYGCEEVQEIL